MYAFCVDGAQQEFATRLKSTSHARYVMGLAARIFDFYCQSMARKSAVARALLASKPWQ